MGNQDFGYLQHPTNASGRVAVRSVPVGEWEAYYEGRWRKVHMQVNRLYIVYQGERITIQIDGV
jgi:hypothetical protein